MVDKAKEYDYNPLRELVTLFLKDIEVKYRNRLKRALFLVSDNDKISKDRLERLAKGDFTQEGTTCSASNKPTGTTSPAHHPHQHLER